MKDIAFGVRDLIEKVREARVGVESVGQLRKIAVPEDGTSFMVQKVPYIFVADDKTDDDGISSIRPDSIPASKGGRYLRAMIEPRQKSAL